jgi:hypothetical protein
MAHIVLSIFNILQNLFIWNNAITKILNSELHICIHASYIVATQLCVGVRGPWVCSVLLGCPNSYKDEESLSVQYVARGAAGRDKGSLSVQYVLEGPRGGIKGPWVCNMSLGGPRVGIRDHLMCSM